MTTLATPRMSRRYLRHGTLPQLAAFEAVVRLGSATLAAEALCIAQPTLSGHLRKLGETLGVRLFEMRGKHLVPTDAALVLLQTAHEVFAAFERCEQVLQGLRAMPHLDRRVGDVSRTVVGQLAGNLRHAALMPDAARNQASNLARY